MRRMKILKTKRRGTRMLIIVGVVLGLLGVVLLIMLIEM